ncbi:hypothetical protein CEXT_708561 [Caerostris extrusa]|uniref:Uncharacterized protein n=1 Tax=Caerostris extrusa TaxID=172846 RepID=A0AAV4S256_CAEEX|nr:hypothetical protein CEXT_708561 [Caerostris extrusa]
MFWNACINIFKDEDYTANKLLNIKTNLPEFVGRRFEQNHATTTRIVGPALGVSRSIVWRTLNEGEKHLYHL